MTHNITGSEAFDPREHVPVRFIRDRKAWKRAMIGFCSDAVDALEALGAFVIYAADGRVEGRRLALWGAGVIAFGFWAGVFAVLFLGWRP